MTALQLGVKREPQHPSLALDAAPRPADGDNANPIGILIREYRGETRFGADKHRIGAGIGKEIFDIRLGAGGEPERGGIDPDKIDDLNVGLKISAEHRCLAGSCHGIACMICQHHIKGSFKNLRFPASGVLRSISAR